MKDDFVFQPIYAPWSTKLVDERWTDAKNLDQGIEMMKQGDYAYLEASQTMLQALGLLILSPLLY